MSTGMLDIAASYHRIHFQQIKNHNQLTSCRMSEKTDDTVSTKI